ncbi:MAG: hypothetical protein HKP53_01740 [Eudoraea sp.]|nr:hypothetical protein [Eudoraea sp.]
MKALISLFIFSFCFLGLAQSKDPAGTLKDSVRVSLNSDESYALYLPGNYDAESLSPIVFIFDPAGRGVTGLHSFIEAADKYSYILICSNDSKNGPYSPNLKIADNLFKEVLNTYAVDQNRIYTAGFSGGSRLAATIAVLSNSIRGVIACGAGFAKSPMYFPNVQNSFSYAALVGHRDMNYQEMKKTVQWASKIGLPNELFVFRGEHQWPPSAEILKAFDWLQNEAVRQGLERVNYDTRVLEYQRSISLADSLEKNSHLQDAANEYERLLRKYPDLTDGDHVKANLKRIKKLRSFKKAEGIENKVAILEDSLSQRFLQRFGQESMEGKSADDFKWWNNQLLRFNKKYSEHKYAAYRDMAYRINRQLFAVVIESFDAFLLDENDKEAAYCEDLLMVIAPDSPFTHYQMARRYATKNMPDKSLEHLAKVLALGWNDKEFIRNTKEFSKLRSDPAFIELLEGNK